MKKENKKTEKEEKNSECSDRLCPFHAGFKTRGKVFEGKVTRKFQTRVAIEFERTVFVHKYERYEKRKTRIHARLPACMDVKIGDFVKVRECRPLSKIIHFIVIEKMKKSDDFCLIKFYEDGRENLR